MTSLGWGRYRIIVGLFEPVASFVCFACYSYSGFRSSIKIMKMSNDNISHVGLSIRSL